VHELWRDGGFLAHRVNSARAHTACFDDVAGDGEQLVTAE
jgi:hypothetical protein